MPSARVRVATVAAEDAVDQDPVGALVGGAVGIAAATPHHVRPVVAEHEVAVAVAVDQVVVEAAVDRVVAGPAAHRVGAARGLPVGRQRHVGASRERAADTAGALDHEVDPSVVATGDEVLHRHAEERRAVVAGLARRLAEQGAGVAEGGVQDRPSITDHGVLAEPAVHLVVAELAEQVVVACVTADVVVALLAPDRVVAVVAVQQVVAVHGRRRRGDTEPVGTPEHPRVGAVAAGIDVRCQQ